MNNAATGVVASIGIDSRNRTVVRVSVTKTDGRRVEVNVHTDMVSFAALAELGVRVYNEMPRDSKAASDR